MVYKEIARKFVEVPTSITSKKQVIEGGYLTDDEFEQLVNVPRSTEMLSGTKWPKIGCNGKERTLYPFYSVLLPHEKQMYREYRKSGTRDTVPRSTRNAEHNEKVNKLYEELKAAGVGEELLAQVAALKVVTRAGDFEKVFGFAPETNTRVTTAYLMFRDTQGNFLTEHEPDVAECFAQGCRVGMDTKSLYKALVKLRAAGYELEKYVIDYEEFMGRWSKKFEKTA